jgi:hypothetical protein
MQERFWTLILSLPSAVYKTEILTKICWRRCDDPKAVS